MATLKKEIYGMVMESNKRGPFLKFKNKDKNGKEHTTNVFKKEVWIKFCGPDGKPVPGTYEVVSEKEGEYWEVKDAKLVQPAPAPAPAAQSESGKAEPPSAAQPWAPRPLDVNEVKKNDSISAQVCVKAAAEVIGKAIEQGAFKGEGGIDVSSVIDTTALLSRTLMREVNKFPELVGAPAGAAPQSQHSAEGA